MAAVVWNLYAAAGHELRERHGLQTHSETRLNLLVAIAIAGALLLLITALRS